MKQKNSRLGEKGFSSQGVEGIIIKYYSSSNITVQFADGCIVKNKYYSDFKNKKIRSYNFPSVYNVGYVGMESKLIQNKDAYYKWKGMFSRCYGNIIKNKDTYKDCTVCQEWQNYSNFEKWYIDNIWGLGVIKMELDKDILIKGNKIYSPETCVLVPYEINLLFVKNDKKRKDLPIGVYYDKTRRKYITHCKKYNKSQHIGSYNTIEMAFASYKKFKEEHIQQVADDYKIKHKDFPINLYNAMYDYQVEITD